MKLSKLEFDESPIVIESLKGLLKGFEEDLELAKAGKPTGYVSWDDPEKDKQAIKKEIKALKRVLLLYGYSEN